MKNSIKNRESLEDNMILTQSLEDNKIHQQLDKFNAKQKLSFNSVSSNSSNSQKNAIKEEVEEKEEEQEEEKSQITINNISNNQNQQNKKSKQLEIEVESNSNDNSQIIEDPNQVEINTLHSLHSSSPGNSSLYTISSVGRQNQILYQQTITNLQKTIEDLVSENQDLINERQNMIDYFSDLKKEINEKVKETVNKVANLEQCKVEMENIIQQQFKQIENFNKQQQIQIGEATKKSQEGADKIKKIITQINSQTQTLQNENQLLLTNKLQVCSPSPYKGLILNDITNTNHILHKQAQTSNKNVNRYISKQSTTSMSEQRDSQKSNQKNNNILQIQEIQSVEQPRNFNLQSTKNSQNQQQNQQNSFQSISIKQNSDSQNLVQNQEFKQQQIENTEQKKISNNSSGIQVYQKQNSCYNQILKDIEFQEKNQIQNQSQQNSLQIKSDQKSCDLSLNSQQKLPQKKFTQDNRDTPISSVMLGSINQSCHNISKFPQEINYEDSQDICNIQSFESQVRNLHSMDCNQSLSEQQIQISYQQCNNKDDSQQQLQQQQQSQQSYNNDNIQLLNENNIQNQCFINLFISELEEFLQNSMEKYELSCQNSDTKLKKQLIKQYISKQSPYNQEYKEKIMKVILSNFYLKKQVDKNLKIMLIKMESFKKFIEQNVPIQQSSDKFVKELQEFEKSESQLQRLKKLQLHMQQPLLI